MISTGDKIRIALAPLHVAVGASILCSWMKVGTPTLLVLGLSFCAFGIYRIAQVVRALKRRPR